jgi:hypothetical protein
MATPSAQRPQGNGPDDELDLDLPALDGEEEPTAGSSFGDDLPATPEDDGADPFDDATLGAGAGVEELAALVGAGSEGGYLEDAEAAAGLDIGAIDVSIQIEEKVLGDDEPDLSKGLEDLIQGDEAYVADGGEEGPLAADEELREEDLPALDADEDGEVPDDALFDRSVIGGDDELRWADRAWALAEAPTSLDELDESGMLAVPGERDMAWKALEETGRVMAAAFVPGGAVVLALASPDRARAFLVRIQPNGEQRIIAEVDPRTEDDGSSCVVTGLRWDQARGALVVAGSFGIHAYCPA